MHTRFWCVKSTHCTNWSCYGLTWMNWVMCSNGWYYGLSSLLLCIAPLQCIVGHVYCRYPRRCHFIVPMSLLGDCCAFHNEDYGAQHCAGDDRVSFFLYLPILLTLRHPTTEAYLSLPTLAAHTASFSVEIPLRNYDDYFTTYCFCDFFCEKLAGSAWFCPCL